MILNFVNHESIKHIMKAGIRITVRGRLDETWEEWFEGMEIMNAGEYTILSGYKRDEAFVHGILNKIRDLNLELISVTAMDAE